VCNQPPHQVKKSMTLYHSLQTRNREKGTRTLGKKYGNVWSYNFLYCWLYFSTDSPPCSRPIFSKTAIFERFGLGHVRCSRFKQSVQRFSGTDCRWQVTNRTQSCKTLSGHCQRIDSSQYAIECGSMGFLPRFCDHLQNNK